MGTVIDELVVLLKLDPKQFDQATKDQVSKLRVFEREHERHSKKMAKDTDALTQAFSLLQGRLLAIAGLFMGGMGIGAFTEQITKLTAQTGYLATSLGMSTAEITKWQAVGALRGASPGEMTGSIASVRNAISDLRNGRPTEMQKFSYMTAQSGQGPFVDLRPETDPTEFMISVSRWLEAQKKKGPAAYAAGNRAVSSMLGFGQGTINALDMGPDELRKQLKAMEKYAPSEAQTKKFQDLQAAMARAATAAESLGRLLVERLAGPLTTLFEVITKIVDKISGFLGHENEQRTQEFYDKHMPEASGGPTSIFGRVKSWIKRKTGIGGSDDGAGSQPGGVGAGTAANDNVGAGLGGSAFLKARRKRMMDEINASPELRRKVAAMAVSEGSKDPVPVIESLFNRADYQGKTINEMLTPKFYGPMRTGAFNKALSDIDRNPTLNARMQRAIDAVGAGSHIIGGRTDQGLPTDPNGMWGYGTPVWMKRGGNVFTDWGGGRGGHAGAARYRNMIEQGLARDSLPSAEASTGSFDTLWNSRIGNLGGARSAMRSGGGVVNNNQRSNETHIGNMTVTVPPGADPAGYARGISQELQRYDNVMKSNEGLL